MYIYKEGYFEFMYNKAVLTVKYLLKRFQKVRHLRGLKTLKFYFCIDVVPNKMLKNVKKYIIFKTLNLTRTRVLLNLSLERSVIQANKTKEN